MIASEELAVPEISTRSRRLPNLGRNSTRQRLNRGTKMDSTRMPPHGLGSIRCGILDQQAGMSACKNAESFDVHVFKVSEKLIDDVSRRRSIAAKVQPHNRSGGVTPPGDCSTILGTQEFPKAI